MNNYLDYIDEKLVPQLENFWTKVNQRTEKQYGLRADYDSEGDDALGEEVEYFHPAITCDDRMRYIMEHIVTLPNSVVSPRNKVCNTIISHFYGARGIHSLLTGESDPSKAHLDFERLAADDRVYTEEARDQALAMQAAKKKFYGTTELHTSLQTAARNYCRVKYHDDHRKATVFDIAEWIASWVADGSIDHILNHVKTLQDMFTYLRTKAGVGEYYGYHCATSNSVNPALPFDHDERFCAPGPGARATLDELFAPLKTVPGYKRLPYGDLVIALREQQHHVFKPEAITPHPHFWNFKGVFKEDQNELKTYGTEVGCCQFGVYRWLKKNPHLIKNRKVARVDLDESNVNPAASCVLVFD